ADRLVEADVVRLRTGVRETWPTAALGLRYRHSELPDDAVVVAATLELVASTPSLVAAAVEDVRAWRRRHQPVNAPTCGSVFTNPPGDSAGRLIDAAGAKGMTVGGACVSTTHANFIETRRGARADDVLALIRQVQARVVEHAGVRLEPEVRILGDVAGIDGDA